MQPLADLKVLDFCWVAAGPMTTGYLAEYGATVVRVESRQRPDVLRGSPPFGGKGKGLQPQRLLRQLQRQQVRAGPQPGASEGDRHRQALRRLGRPGHREFHARDDGTMRARLRRPARDQARHHHVQHLDAGPRRTEFEPAGIRRGALVAERHDGHHRLAGSRARPIPTAPTRTSSCRASPLPPSWRRSTIAGAPGIGQHLDMSQLEVSLHFIAPACSIARSTAAKGAHGQSRRGGCTARRVSVPGRGSLGHDRLHDRCALAGVAAGDGRSRVEQDERFCDAARAQGATRTSWKPCSPTGRARGTRVELMQRCRAPGIPAGVVHSNQGVIEDPQLEHRGHFVYYEHPELGRHPVQRSEFRLLARYGRAELAVAGDRRAHARGLQGRAGDERRRGRGARRGRRAGSAGAGVKVATWNI